MLTNQAQEVSVGRPLLAKLQMAGRTSQLEATGWPEPAVWPRQDGKPAAALLSRLLGWRQIQEGAGGDISVVTEPWGGEPAMQRAASTLAGGTLGPTGLLAEPVRCRALGCHSAVCHGCGSWAVALGGETLSARPHCSAWPRGARKGRARAWERRCEGRVRPTVRGHTVRRAWAGYPSQPHFCG